MNKLLIITALFLVGCNSNPCEATLNKVARCYGVSKKDSRLVGVIAQCKLTYAGGDSVGKAKGRAFSNAINDLSCDEIKAVYGESAF